MHKKDMVVELRQYAANKRIKNLLQKINPMLTKKDENIRIHLEALANDVITKKEYQVIRTKMELGKFCLDLEHAIPDSHVTMLFYCKNQNKIYHGAAPNFPVEFFDFFYEINDTGAFGENCGSCGAAVHNRKVVVTDIQTSPLWEPFREHFTQYGLYTGWSIPFFKENDVMGTFAIYHSYPKEVTKEEILLGQQKVKEYQNSINQMVNRLIAN
ncbi:GAF domain-containing protein [Bacillus tuaregi]|uniref:GAF domain-containing protein n=1 Tax=Bacillus tuaregi TaxID=1816695 RepID=UPI0008F8A63A|nr:GAF domain-containing protein [Bacillus tuaregi]